MSGAYMVAGSYNIPHTRLEGYCVYTNQVPGGYFRAPGETQTLFAVESHIDMMAEALGMEPLELRRLNCLKDGNTRATGEPLTDPHCVEVLDRVAKISNWRRKRNQRPTASSSAAAWRWATAMGHGDSSFELVLERDGTLRLLSGGGRPGVGAI
jgi:CO/xanthine dehydrogenase Mo-binding subunit